MRTPTVRRVLTLALALPALSCAAPNDDTGFPETRPNIVLIYADDLGYGDLGSYGATSIQTPNIDRLASAGLRFTDAHSPSATCTPSRYALLTGTYAWRKEGTGIARGDAPLIIDPAIRTLPSALRDVGYRTGVIGKWHLGLGSAGGPDWNGEVKPGPLEIGFDESFLVPATGDRVPTVYVEDHRVVGLDPADPITVSFEGPVDDAATGRERPDLLKMLPSHGHDMTIVNGISRIGYMSGGEAARWVDEDMADVLTGRAIDFIERNSGGPFFLYYSTHDIHVPRVPHARFAGESGLGPRGDVILQLDWAVGEIVTALERLGLADNTLVLFSSDNGPVLDDGYQDQAVELQGGHEPSGPWRGGKYSAYEAGTRVPFIVHWPGVVEAGESDALVSQIDLYASLSALVGAEIQAEDAPDSSDQLGALFGRTAEGREYVVEHNSGGTLSLIRGSWKYIEPSDRRGYNSQTAIELGNEPNPQLYDLTEDPGERNNLAAERPDLVEELSALLREVRDNGGSRM